MVLVDYTDTAQNCFTYKGALKVHGLGWRVRSLHRLDNPVTRLDGKKGLYRLTENDLSVHCKSPDDEAYTCVSNSDYILLTAREASKYLKRGAKLFQ